MNPSAQQRAAALTLPAHETSQRVQQTMATPKGESSADDPYLMTEEKLRNRALIINRGKYLPQLYCALTVSLGSVCFGIVLGWSCPMIRHHLDEAYGNVIMVELAALAPLGACIGCAMFQALNETRGPRLVVLVICPLQVIVWVIIAFIKDIHVYRWMIFISGWLSIAFMLCGETLLWDSVHAGYTTQFRILAESNVLLGVLVSYIIGLTTVGSFYFSIAGAICVTITFVMYLFLPESPVFLYGKNPLKAEKALTYLRGEDNIYDDMRHIKNDYETRAVDVSAKYMLTKRSVYRPLLVLIAVHFFREFTGYYALLSFGLTILSTQGPHDTTVKDIFGRLEDAVILGLFLYFSRIISSAVLSSGKYGVRKPLIVSSVMVTLLLTMLSVFFYLADILAVVPDDFASLKIILNCAFIASYELGYSCTPSIMEIDYLPFQVYPWVKLFTMSSTYLFDFILVMLIILIGIDDDTTWQNYMFLSCVSFAGVVFNCVFLVESKGNTLMQIQGKFGGNPMGSRSSRQTKRMMLQK